MCLMLVAMCAVVAVLLHILTNERALYSESLKRVQTRNYKWGVEDGIQKEKERRENEMIEYMKQPWQQETEP
jgi:hypothetical protein